MYYFYSSHFSVTDTVFIQQFTETGTELDNRAVVEYDNIDDTVNEMLRLIFKVQNK